MANLYEIDSKIKELIDNGFNEDCVDTETGEIDEGKYQAILEQFQMELNSKIENIACYIKNIDSDIKAFKEEENKLAARRLSLERKEESLKTYLSNSLLTIGQNKFMSTRANVSFRKSVQVNIIDQLKIPNFFMKEKVEVTVDKTAIKSAIASGQAVEGAELIEKQNIQIK